jgi:hypothetical protein
LQAEDADNNPVSSSDPSGLWLGEGPEHKVFDIEAIPVHAT